MVLTIPAALIWRYTYKYSAIYWCVKKNCSKSVKLLWKVKNYFTHFQRFSIKYNGHSFVIQNRLNVTQNFVNDIYRETDVQCARIKATYRFHLNIDRRREISEIDSLSNNSERSTSVGSILRLTTENWARWSKL